MRLFRTRLSQERMLWMHAYTHIYIHTYKRIQKAIEINLIKERERERYIYIYTYACVCVYLVRSTAWINARVPK